MSEPRHTGGCLCGAVAYEARGPLRDVEVCHSRGDYYELTDDVPRYAVGLAGPGAMGLP